MSDPTTQLFDTWRRQLEESTQAWTKLVGQVSPPAAPADPMAFWRPVLNQGLEAWARMFAQTPASPDLATQWKQFLDQWIEAWSRVLGQAMNTEGFAQMMGRSLEQMLAAQAPVKKAGEQALDQLLVSLNLASRSQLTGVAKQIVELEERLERVEDGIQAILRRLDARAPMIGKTIAELAAGDRAEITRVVEQDDIAAFVDAVGDYNPVHSDPAYAAATPFKAPIAPGIFTAGLISAVIGTELPGPGAIYLSQSLKFVKPVKAGDVITARAEIVEMLPERNRVRLQTVCVNQHGDEVLSGEAWIMPSRTRVVYEGRVEPEPAWSALAYPWTWAAQAMTFWGVLSLSMLAGAPPRRR
jgi:acyl dehydratase